MNWIAYFLRALTLAPQIVNVVEALVTEAKSGATKKQLAMESLGVGTSIAAAIAPQHQANFAAVSAGVSSAIDSIVAVKNAVGAFGTSAPVTEPAPGGGKVTGN